ncbi:MAG: DUF6498-containing protein [Candidatus Gottesmanbacteria bacterium]
MIKINTTFINTSSDNSSKGSPGNIQFNFKSSYSFNNKLLFHLDFKDPSLYLLLFTNLSTIYFAYIEHWNLLTVMWIYWFQSIIIGLFTFVRLINLRNYNSRAISFIISYGIFHMGFLVFLLLGFLGNATRGIVSEFGFVLMSAFLFFVNHLFSYFYNKDRDQEGFIFHKDVDRIISISYMRIIPMHIIIILGQIITSIFLSEARYTLFLFLFLKTYADLYSHTLKHTSAASPIDVKNS